MRAATPCGFYRGRKYYRVPVDVRLNSSRLCATLATVRYSVIAESSAAAADLVRGWYLEAERPETEVIAYGPKGGKAQRYIGHYSVIGHALINREPGTRQLELQAVGE